MKEYKGLVFLPVEEGDIEPLTAVMRRAFDEDSRLHLGIAHGGPPGYDNGEFLRRYALDKAATAYKIMQNGAIVAGMILWIRPDGRNTLGALFVDAPLENRGLGKTIWEFAQQEYPDTVVWRSETPIYAHRNHHFYVNKCGFHVVKIVNPRDITTGEGSFILEKRMK